MRLSGSRKADISMNTIVYAAIAILVLLVIILVFTNNIRKPANEVNEVNDDRSNMIDDITGREHCDKSKTGSCQPEEDCKKGDGTISLLYSCNEKGYVCCIK